MAALESVRRESPASFDPSSVFASDATDATDESGDTGESDAPVSTGRNALVVHAPGFDREGVVGDVAAAASATRLGPDADAAGPAVTDSVVIEDLYARYGERGDGRAGGAATLDRLRERLDGPGTVAAFVEPYELDWLCRGERDESLSVEEFDRVVHLRYNADDTARGGDVDEAVTAATGRLDDDIDASDEELRGVLGANRYRHEYEHAGDVLDGKTFGPAMVPEVVPEIVTDLPREAWTSDNKREWLRDRLIDLADTATLREAFSGSESALKTLLASTGTTTAVLADGLTGGAATVTWFAVQYLSGDDDLAVLDDLGDTRLPPPECAELDAERGVPPGTTAVALELFSPERMRRVVEIAREDGVFDQIEKRVDEHGERLDEYGETLDAHDERLNENSERTDILRVRLSIVEDRLVAHREPDPDGIDRVTRENFEMGGIDDEHCWRRSFTLAEAWAGYPLERERPLADGGRQDLTEQLLDTLADGGGAALLGAPGSGKTTATRTAIAAWYRRHDGGTVFYREQGLGDPLDAETLTEAVESAREDGPVLIAAEDAARRGSYPVFETIAAFERADDVSFLVNAREGEWRDSADDLHEAYGDAQQRQKVERVQPEAFTPVNMPPLDEREVERFLDNYAAVTGDEVSLDGDSEAILSQIRGYEGVSPMLLLAYYLPVWQTETRVDTEVPALIENVREVFRFARGESERAPTLSEDEQSAMERVALAVNVLNVAEAPVRKDFLLAVGGGDEFDAVTTVWDSLTGPLLFDVEDDDLVFATHHPLWSELYLSHHLEECGSRDAAEAFESVVNDLFALIDDEELREAIRRELRTDTTLLKLIEREPEAFTRQFVKSVFEIGEDRPELQPLYGTSAYSGIELPSARGARTAVNAAFRRARMFNSRGEADREREEIEWAWEKAEEAGIDEEVIAARYHTRRGHYARQQGDFETARDHYEQAREEAPDESRNEATSLTNLGAVAQSLGEYEQAREYHHQSLAILQEIGDRAGEANSLTNLGGVARNLGEYEQAREYHEESLAIKREIGDRADEATSLNNLGSVAGEQEDYGEAERRHREALEISEEIGDRSSVANQQYNVGVGASRQGDLERALEWLQRSKTTYAELGVDHRVLDCLESISRIAQRLNRTETAREACEDALELIEQSDLDRLDDRAREFRVRDARLDETPAGTLRLYRHALGHALEGEGGTAGRLFSETWERRDTHDEDSPVVSATLAAGVGFAAHLTLAAEIGEDDTADDETPNPNDVLTEIDPAELTTPATSLYHSLTYGVPSTTPATLREQADDTEPEDLIDQINVLERRAYAGLIELLSETDDGGATVTERYERALFRLAHDSDTDAVVDTLVSLWNERGDYDSGTDAHAAVSAAGVWLAAFDSDGEDAPVDAETVIQSVDPTATPLSDAVRAVYDHLAGDEPEYTPNDLRERIDPLFSDPDIDQLETAVFGNALAALTGAGPEDYSTEELYRQALVEALAEDTDIETIVELTEHVWERRDGADTEANDLVVAAAGVAFAAHLELFSEPAEADNDRIDEVLSSVNPDATPLSDAVCAVYDALAGDEPEYTADELHDRADSLSADDNLEQLETVVFANVLSSLTDHATEPTEERYRETITEIARGDTDMQTALTQLHSVWTHHDDPETDAAAVTVAAGVALAAYAELVPDQTAAVVDDLDALPPRENTPETPLPDAVRALRDHLAGDDPETTPDELKGRVDDRQDPAPADAEPLVFARLLAALRSD